MPQFECVDPGPRRPGPAAEFPHPSSAPNARPRERRLRGERGGLSPLAPRDPLDPTRVCINTSELWN